MGWSALSCSSWVATAPTATSSSDAGVDRARSLEGGVVGSTGDSGALWLRVLAVRSLPQDPSLPRFQ
jgi:hypothetical protein